MPVSPAMNAGTQPPLGVIDTTQPSASAAWIEVVPARNGSSSPGSPESLPSPGLTSSLNTRPPGVEQVGEGIHLALIWVRIAGLDTWVVTKPVDLRAAVAGVGL